MWGAWTWYSEPRAVRVENKTVVGCIDNIGSVKVWTYHHATQRGGDPVTLHPILEADDHDNPALLVRASDSRLMAFYTKHAVGQEYYMRVSTNPNDASAWQAEVNLDAALGQEHYTYANPIQLTDEDNDPIYLFFRVGFGGSLYSKSIDGGATWSAAVQWLTNGANRPYVKLIQNGDARIDFAFTDGHPVNVATNSIYHGYYQGGNWYKSDGTLVGGVGDLPFGPADFTKVYDGATVRGWIHDIVIDATGKPVLVYAAFPETTDHRYRYARWTGTEWADAEICAAGGYLYVAELYYSGGVVIDPTNVNVVIASRSVDAGLHQLYKHTTADGGATWDAGELLTTGIYKAIRPVFVRGATENPRLMYLTGLYTSFTDYNLMAVLRDA